MTELWSLSAAELTTGYRAGTFTPSDALAAALQRIEAVNPTLNAHWHVAAESATVAAAEAGARWRAGRARALEGVPVGVKDVVDVAGMPCTGGSVLYRHRVAGTDATVAARLRAAGAVILTKDATTEFAIGGPVNPLFGPTRNPWQPEHWTGGSSAGAGAAVAAGTVPLAVGTDAGGSVRIPAAWSGVVGLKPTMGRVSRRGVMPLSWHAEVIGPLARTVADAAAMLGVLAGFDPADPRSADAPFAPVDADVAGMRIGVPAAWWAGLADDDAEQVVADAAEALTAAGARIVPVPPLPSARELHELAYRVIWAEACWLHAVHRPSDPVVVERIAAGEQVTAAEYFALLQRRSALQREMAALFEHADVLLTPTTVVAAPRLDDLTVPVDGVTVPVHAAYGMLTAHANLTGFPALAVPAGVNAAGLPLSVQFLGAPWREADCCRAGAAYQRVTGPVTDIPVLPPVTAPPSTSAPEPGTGYVDGRFDPGGVDPFLLARQRR